MRNIPKRITEEETLRDLNALGVPLFAGFVFFMAFGPHTWPGFLIWQGIFWFGLIALCSGKEDV